MTQPTTPDPEQPNRPQPSQPAQPATPEQQFQQGFQNQSSAPSAFSAAPAGQQFAPNAYGQAPYGQPYGQAPFGQQAYGYQPPQREQGGLAAFFSTDFSVALGPKIARLVMIFALILAGVYAAASLVSFIQALAWGNGALMIIYAFFDLGLSAVLILFLLGITRIVLEYLVRKASPDDPGSASSQAS